MLKIETCGFLSKSKGETAKYDKMFFQSLEIPGKRINHVGEIRMTALFVKDETFFSTKE